MKHSCKKFKELERKKLKKKDKKSKIKVLEEETKTLKKSVDNLISLISFFQVL
jgi:hypothetical protein